MSSIDELLQRTFNALAKRRRLPGPTYRLQFHAGFTFGDAIEIVDYLHHLGVGDCYASPYLTALPGSTHGYDVINHNQINPELGGNAGLQRWVDALAGFGMSHILDTVPNHVGIATNHNAWWNNVLEHGPASPYAGFFDITWRGSPELHDKVLLPLLGAPYGQVLEKGELALTSEKDGLKVTYYDRTFPVSTVKWRREGRNTDDLKTLNGTVGEPHSFDALDHLLNQQSYRLAYWRTAPDEINYRRFFDINDLAALRQEREEVFLATHRLTLGLLAEGKVVGLRIDHPDGLLDPEQYFRRLQKEYVLACAAAEFNAERHRSKQSWSDIEPAVRERLETTMLDSPAGDRPLYVVAEKILAIDEPLPGDWPIHGTSGYHFLNMVNGLFVDSTNRHRMTEVYRRFTGCEAAFSEIVYQKQKLILKIALASELNMLARRLERLAQKDRHSRDFTLNGLRRALCEVIACFPVYRSYITSRGVPEADISLIELAVTIAIRRNPANDRSIFDFIRDTLLLRYPAAGDDVNRNEQSEFAGRFQQLTAPVTAKGIEDTTFYIYNRLLSLNEVGGDPDRFGTVPKDLHEYLSKRQSRWPFALSALTTHDTKRSEDARARINVLSELPDEWGTQIERWSKLNDRHRTGADSLQAPDRNEEYMFYQSLIGACPLTAGAQAAPSPLPALGAAVEEWTAFVDRIQQFMKKALREAKLHTSWTDPNQAYENAVAEFVARSLDREVSGEFLEDFGGFAARLSHWGMLNSLSQTLLRFVAPGVPDTYQGTELWDFSLVDPDNRRPVDYPRRRQMLDELRSAQGDRRQLARELLETWEDGRVKLYVTQQALHGRRREPDLFTRGSYVAMTPAGCRRDHLFGFARKLGEKLAVLIVPRLFTRLTPDGRSLPLGNQVWQDTWYSVPGAKDKPRLQNVFTGEPIQWETRDGEEALSVGPALAHFPIALFM
jgi:(1->4)-alpha-D-glucan 1-alpha-D-glucosylmutase